MHRYNCEITDPDIPGMFMYERMDVKVPPTGHTYLINDTWFGAVSIHVLFIIFMLSAACPQVPQY